MKSKVFSVILALALVCLMTTAAAYASSADASEIRMPFAAASGIRVPFADAKAAAAAPDTSGRTITDSTEIYENEVIDGANIKDPSMWFGLHVSTNSDDPVSVRVLNDFIITADRKDNPEDLWGLDLNTNTSVNLDKNLIMNVTNIPNMKYADTPGSISGADVLNASVKMRDLIMNLSADTSYTNGIYNFQGLSSRISDHEKEEYSKFGNITVTADTDVNCDTMRLSAIELSVAERNSLPWKATVWADGNVNASAAVKNGNADVYSVYGKDWSDCSSPGVLDMRINGEINTTATTGNGTAYACGVYLRQLPGTLVTGPVAANAKSDNIAEAYGLVLRGNVEVEKILNTIVNGPVIATAEKSASGTDTGAASAHAVWLPDSDEDAYADLLINGDVISYAVDKSEGPAKANPADYSTAILVGGNHTNATIKGNIRAEGFGPNVYSHGVSAEEGGQIVIEGSVDVYAEGNDADAIGILADNFEDEERTTKVTAGDVNVTAVSGKPTRGTFGITTQGPSSVQVNNVTVTNGTGIKMTKDANITLNGNLNVPATGAVKSAILINALSEEKDNSGKGTLLIRGTVYAPDGAGILVYGDGMEKSALIDNLPELVPNIFVHGFKVGGSVAEGKGAIAESSKQPDYELTKDEIQKFIDGINYIINVPESQGYSVSLTGGADWSDEYGFYYAQAGDAIDFSVTVPDLKHGIRSVSGGDGNQVVDHGDGTYSLIISENGGADIGVHLFETVYAALGRTYSFSDGAETGDPSEWLCTKVDHGTAKLRLVQGFEKSSVPDDKTLLESLPESLKNIMVKDDIDYEDDISERIFKDGLAHPIVYVNVFDITY